MINFEKYCEPIVAGRIKETDIHKLWQNIAPHLRKAVKTVYLRQVSSDQWKKLESAEKEQPSVCKTLFQLLRFLYDISVLLLLSPFKLPVKFFPRLKTHYAQ